MTIDEAVSSLVKHLNDDEVFYVYHNDDTIFVRVYFAYRTKDVENLNGVWEGFPVKMGKVSCW
jgi:hypothetical protein